MIYFHALPRWLWYLNTEKRIHQNTYSRYELECKRAFKWFTSKTKFCMKNTGISSFKVKCANTKSLDELSISNNKYCDKSGPITLSWTTPMKIMKIIRICWVSRDVSPTMLLLSKLFIVSFQTFATLNCDRGDTMTPHRVATRVSMAPQWSTTNDLIITSRYGASMWTYCEGMTVRRPSPNNSTRIHLVKSQLIWHSISGVWHVALSCTEWRATMRSLRCKLSPSMHYGISVSMWWISLFAASWHSLLRSVVRCRLYSRQLVLVKTIEDPSGERSYKITLN